MSHGKIHRVLKGEHIYICISNLISYNYKLLSSATKSQYILLIDFNISPVYITSL